MIYTAYALLQLRNRPLANLRSFGGVFILKKIWFPEEKITNMTWPSPTPSTRLATRFVNNSG